MMAARLMVATNLTCSPSSRPLMPVPSALQPTALLIPPLSTVAPAGWMQEQLLIEANGLAGYLSTSSFPGADRVNSSLWTNRSSHPIDSITQWLPYWTNGIVPLVGLLESAGATGRIHSGVGAQIDEAMSYVLAHTNKTNGWIGPYTNEPGDTNGHGLWDPLNMLRSLLQYSQYRVSLERLIAAACIAHLIAEARMIATDPIIKWAATRWPTYVEIAFYVVDNLIPKYATDAMVLPLGAEATSALLLNASALFASKGMDWRSYYHQVGRLQFPEGSVPGWNTHDHGVNNAEGAMRWPAVTWRLTGDPDDAAQQEVMLHMLDTYQGQVATLFCADEIFCGRAPHRGVPSWPDLPLPACAVVAQGRVPGRVQGHVEIALCPRGGCYCLHPSALELRASLRSRDVLRARPIQPAWSFLSPTASLSCSTLPLPQEPKRARSWRRWRASNTRGQSLAARRSWIEWSGSA